MAGPFDANVIITGEALIDLVDENDGHWTPYPGGASFNTAVAAARLGVPTRFLGRFGQDALAPLLTNRLIDAGVDLSLSSSAVEPTTLATVHVDDDGHASYGFYLAATSAIGFDVGDLPSSIEAPSAVVTGCLAIALEPVGTATERYVLSQPPTTLVMLDPNIRAAVIADRVAWLARWSRLRARAHLVKVSDADLEWIAPGDAIDMARRWLSDTTMAVCVTRGGDGVSVVLADEVIDVPAVRVDVVDTIGAGDSFSGGLLCALYERDLLSPAGLATMTPALWFTVVSFAVRVAGFTCSRPGADPPWRYELD